MASRWMPPSGRLINRRALNLKTGSMVRGQPSGILRRRSGEPWFGPNFGDLCPQGAGEFGKKSAQVRDFDRHLPHRPRDGHTR